MRLLSSRNTCISDLGMFKQAYRINRKRSQKLFSLVKNALYERPLLRRNSFLFYWGHLPVFSYTTLAKVCNRPPLNPELTTLFGRGIDPSNDEDAQTLQPTQWPDLDFLHITIAQLDRHIEAMLEESAAPHADSLQIEAAYTILEHEQMHQETLLYLITSLADDKKSLAGNRADQGRSSTIASEQRVIPAGLVTLGAERGAQAFGWDNEFEATQIEVSDFALSTLPITNGEYLAYIKQGARPPWYWFEQQDLWYIKTPLGALPLPLDWPVYVSFEEAMAYAKSKGARIMTEAEFHRAAFGTPTGVERAHPWGMTAPREGHGNFGFRRLLPEAVGLSPAGCSAWQIHELVGNGWEITATPFQALPGFTPMTSYPQYSADFFDGKHIVVKGASPVTAIPLLRRSLRNWFFADYPYAFTKFRLAYDV